jgi:hypothetical protein
MGVLTPLLKYRNPDKTSDINTRLKTLVTKGIFSGGQVSPVANQLAINVGAFSAVGNDGMITIHDISLGPTTLLVTAGITQWIVLYAAYNDNAPPTLNFQVLTSAPVDPNQITIAQVSPPPLATQVDPGDISYVLADEVDPIQRLSYRGHVATYADLPQDDSSTPYVNREGDTYLVTTDMIGYPGQQLYAWISGAWTTVTDTLLAGLLTKHRANGFVDEQHLTGLPDGSTGEKYGIDNTVSTLPLGAVDAEFGTQNIVVDAATKLALPTRILFTGLSTVSSVTLTGKFYIGHGTTGSATKFFQLLGRTVPDNVATIKGIGILNSFNNVVTLSQVGSGVGNNAKTGDFVIVTLAGTAYYATVTGLAGSDAITFGSPVIAAIVGTDPLSNVAWEIRGSQDCVLTAGVGGFIPIEAIYDHANGSELNPSVVADADGFYAEPTNTPGAINGPTIRLKTLTGGVSTFTGDLTVLAYQRGSLGTITPDVFTKLSPIYPSASQIRVKAGLGWTAGLGDLQAALDAVQLLSNKYRGAFDDTSGVIGSAGEVIVFEDILDLDNVLPPVGRGLFASFAGEGFCTGWPNTATYQLYIGSVVGITSNSPVLTTTSTASNWQAFKTPVYASFTNPGGLLVVQLTMQCSLAAGYAYIRNGAITIG